jgi:short-subunit dehydrogenase
MSKVALITGASSGIGATFAKHLAAKGYDLVLVARRKDVLEEIAGQLQQAYGIQARVFAADLTLAEDVERVCNEISQLSELEILVNNAGFGTQGKFFQVPIDKHQQMLELHVMAATRLAYAALQIFLAKRRGAIINMSSISAFVPFPGSVNYHATKAYLAAFSEGLQTELRNSGVVVQALCPGFTYSSFHDTLDLNDFRRNAIPSIAWGSADQVVETSLNALETGRLFVIPRWINQGIVLLARSLLIRPIVKWVANWALLRTWPRNLNSGKPGD